MRQSVDLHNHDARVWAVGQRRLKILAALAAAGPTTKESIAAAAWELGIGRAYCYRLLRRYRDDPTITGLMPRSRGRLIGTRVLDPAVDALVEAAIDEFYLSPECPSMAGLVREVARRCSRSALTAPTYKAILARVQARRLRDVLMKRKGAASARAKTTRIVGHLVVEKPLVLVQIDHTLADVIVVAEGSRLPIGRPWLTLAIDVATRMVAGFYLSLERPSALAVALVLSHAVLPKTGICGAGGWMLPGPCMEFLIAFIWTTQRSSIHGRWRVASNNMESRSIIGRLRSHIGEGTSSG